MSKPRREHALRGLAFWLLVACGVVFRLYDLDRRPVWYDEAHTLLWLSGYTWTEVADRVSGRLVTPEELLAFQRTSARRGVPSTVSSLARNDPQHPPLYFTSARVWAAVAGGSIASVRSFSSVLGLLLLPGVLLLGHELFRERRAALLATLLVALSPYHVFYAREARPYSLLAAVAVWSSFLLVRAHRRGGRLDWGLYAASVVLGLYTHLFFSLVLVSHALHALVPSGAGGADGREERASRRRFYAAFAVGTISFLPWVLVFLGNVTTAREQVAWMGVSSQRLHLVGMWAFNYSSAFLDVGDAGAFTQGPGAVTVLAYLGRGAILVLSAFAVAHVARSAADRRRRVLLLSLILVPFLALAIPDLVLGGTRSGYAPRLLGVSLLGLELAVAAFLSRLTVLRGWRGVAARLSTAGVLAVSAASAALVATADFWWYAPERSYARDTAAVVNAAHRPVIVQRVHGRMLVLAHHYAPHVRVWPVKEAEGFRLPDGFDEIFVLRPLDESLRVNPHLRLEPTCVHGLSTLIR